MKALSLESTLAAIHIWDLQLCMVVNRSCRLVPIQKFFTAISRMGDGIFWYVWMGMVPLFAGIEGAAVTIQMIVSGVIGLYLYRLIKQVTHRVRPCNASRDIFLGTTLLVVAFPVTAWVLVPFALLVALSRLVLGLHYPTDVLIGGIAGFTLAHVTIFAWTLL